MKLVYATAALALLAENASAFNVARDAANPQALKVNGVAVNTAPPAAQNGVIPQRLRAMDIFEYLKNTPDHGIIENNMSDAKTKVTTYSIDNAKWEAAKKTLLSRPGYYDAEAQEGTSPNTSRSLVKRQDVFQVSCFGSGSWVLVPLLASTITTACARFAWGANQWGRLQITAIDYVYGLELESEAGNPIQVVVIMGMAGFNYGTFNACKYLANYLVVAFCQGKNKDTRGGTGYVKSADGSSWMRISVDPNDKKTGKQNYIL